jgi:hypothetical protein
MKPRIRTLMTVLLALFTLLALSGVAYAWGWSREFMRPTMDSVSPSATPNVAVTPTIFATERPTTVPITLTPSTTSPLVITQFTDTGDSYILAGELNPPAPSQPGEWYIERLSALRIVDGNGQEIYWYRNVPPNSVSNLPVSRSQQDAWEIQIPKVYTPKNQSQSYTLALPLNITETVRYAIRSDSQEMYEFEFDAGHDPLYGQWILKKTFQLAGYTIILDHIVQNFNPSGGTGYDFVFTHDASVNGLSVNLEGYTPIEYSFSGVSKAPGGAGLSHFQLSYSDLPKGRLKVILSDLYLNGETKAWTVDWQP